MAWSLSTVVVLLALVQVSSALNKIQIFSNPVGTNYVEAEKACQSKGGHLASVRDKEEKDDVQYLLQALGDFKSEDCMLTGLWKMNSEWKWRDNTTADYINWAPGFPKKEGRCGCYKIIRGKAMMLNTYWNVKSNFYSCEPGPVAEKNVVVAKNNCDHGWALFDQSCFKEFYGAPVKKLEAARACWEMGAHLAQLGGKKKAEFLVELTEKGNYREFGSQAWIGFGLPKIKSPFYTLHEPIDRFFFKKCAQLNVRPVNGSMENLHFGEVNYSVDCDSTSSRFFCEHPVTKIMNF